MKGRVALKAVVYDKRNSPDVLVFREVEKPIPSDNEVLVRVHAASLNAADYRSMKLGIIPKRKIFGADIAGRVEAVGKGVDGLAVGSEVFGDILGCGSGGFAEYVAVPESALALKPVSVPFETAAAVPMSGITALQALRDKGELQPGHTVLIVGAGGGVGTFAVQIAKHFGAEVTAVCGEKNVQVLQSLGADHVINYNKDDFSKSGKRYDLILAINGNYALTTYKHMLAQKGINVVVGGALSQIFKSVLFGVFMSSGSKKIRSLVAKANRKDLEFIIKLVEDGKIRPIIDRCYPLHETAEAMRYVSDGHAQGKVIIEIARDVCPK